MGCLPPINWCRISQPPTQYHWEYSLELSYRTKMREYEKGFYAPTKGRYTHEYVPRFNRDMTDKTLLAQNSIGGFREFKMRDLEVAANGNVSNKNWDISQHNLAG